ncbi:MAG: urease accessory protein UreD [Chloroflexota bacterium]
MNQTQGHLHLEFTRANQSSESSKTILKLRRQEPPLRVVRAFHPTLEKDPLEKNSLENNPVEECPALVHLHNISGGVLGGDHLTLEVDVQAGAQAQVTTTSATRVYRHRDNRPAATQVNRLSVASGGLLEYLPDALIPFAQSRYRQQTAITLADDAGLFYWEVVAPGRIASGERFDYDLLELSVDIQTPDRPIVIERTKLEPAQHPLASPVRLGGYAYFATFYICRVGWPAAQWQQLEQHLCEFADSLTSSDAQAGESALWGVSQLPAHGLSIRALSQTIRPLLTHLPTFWSTAKKTIYGQRAIMPRKVY